MHHTFFYHEIVVFPVIYNFSTSNHRSWKQHHFRKLWKQSLEHCNNKLHSRVFHAEDKQWSIDVLLNHTKPPSKFIYFLQKGNKGNTGWHVHNFSFSRAKMITKHLSPNITFWSCWCFASVHAQVRQNCVRHERKKYHTFTTKQLYEHIIKLLVKKRSAFLSARRAKMWLARKSLAPRAKKSVECMRTPPKHLKPKKKWTTYTLKIAIIVPKDHHFLFVRDKHVKGLDPYQAMLYCGPGSGPQGTCSAITVEQAALCFLAMIQMTQ